MKEGYFKVAENGGSYVVATFYNPDTHDVFTECVRDYDYDDGSRDNDELYYMPIDEAARVKYLHHNGVILKGDTVEVVKGRKVKLGTVATVTDIKPYYDRYGRVACYYAYLSTGERTNINNCKLIA